MGLRLETTLAIAILGVVAALASAATASADAPRVWLVGDSITQRYGNSSFIPMAAGTYPTWRVSEYGSPGEATAGGLCRSYLLLHNDAAFTAPRADLFGYFGVWPKSCSSLKGYLGPYVYPSYEPPIPPVGEVPDVAVLTFGANDLFGADKFAEPGPCPEEYCGAKRVARTMSAMATAYQQAGAYVIVGLPVISSRRPRIEDFDESACSAGTPPPTQEQIDACIADFREDVQQYWRNSRVLRKELRHIPVARKLSFLVPNMSYMGDYVHPSVPKGTDWMSARVMRFVRSALRKRGQA